MTEPLRIVLYDLTDLPAAVALVQRFAVENTALTACGRFNLRVVQSELTINSFTHGSARNVLFGAEAVNGGIQVWIENDIDTFDPCLCDTEGDMYAERGRGLAIVRELCGQMSYDAALHRLIAIIYDN